MLRLTVSPGEYLMIDKNIKVVFLGGTKSYQRIMIEAPKEVDVVRSTVLEAKVTDPEERAKMPKYYKISDHPKQTEERKPIRKSNMIIVGGGK